MREAKRVQLIWLSLAAVVAALDQLTKIWIAARLPLGQSVEVLPCFRLTHVRNPGAAFSFLASASGWQRWLFLGLAVVAAGAILVWLWRLDERKPWEGVGLALILGGAIGNFIDRARFGYVIDFLDLYYQSWHWPAFNLADAAITLGVALLMWRGKRN
nr:signal peptidase II [uncultured Gammaproteobacteria bacterium]